MAIVAALVAGATAGVLLLGGGVWLAVVVHMTPSIDGVPATGSPETTAYMKRAAASCRDLEWTYTPIEHISPLAACSVIAAEDHRFFHHGGVDWKALRKAATLPSRAKAGGSTIAMQLARNLFLSPKRTVSRKVQEIVLAERLVEKLGRRRVLELYLNIAEWAPCRYGIEAAARALFGRSAADLDLFEATLLTTLLPRPGHPLDPDEAVNVSRRQGLLIRTFRDGGILDPVRAAEELRELDRTWRALPHTGGPDALAQALRARSDARPSGDPAFGAGWLEVGCGLP